LWGCRFHYSLFSTFLLLWDHSWLNSPEWVCEYLNPISMMILKESMSQKDDSLASCRKQSIQCSVLNPALRSLILFSSSLRLLTNLSFIVISTFTGGGSQHP
jgi:hypothetical protein